MKPEIIVALDVDTISEAFHLVGKLEDEIEWYKVGPVLFTKHGPSLIERLKTLNKKVMLDLKFHDIPNTVGKACRAAAEVGADMLTIHLSGGPDMIRAAVDGVEKGSLKRSDKCKVLGISILTSIDVEILRKLGFKHYDCPDIIVSRLIDIGVECEVDGIVCSARETKGVRSQHPGLKIINPGIRMPGVERGDQKRVTTPREAAEAGASFLVMGRGIYAAPYPVQAVKDVLLNLEE